MLAREAAEILGIDPLEHFQEEILEFARLFPKVIRPEKIYGDRWYEFLKKEGIDPKTLEQASGKKPEKSPGVRKGKGKPKKKARPTESADFSRARLEVL
ncbi:hypothetical protein [Thermococcus sp. 2319x1]|uniref:hypothetical protein n=1 Tax=Thermococcus sp. 2319x1 TaxID=1674923 RepID=UPI0015843D8A|nr:hypothetical protein [Thermococcus sp. 2319x1]